jgi:hypothetical protein
MKKHVDLIGDLETAHFAALREAADLAHRLSFLNRLNQATALALATARGRESSQLLAQLIQAEHPTRSKVKKGANGHR